MLAKYFQDSIFQAKSKIAISVSLGLAHVTHSGPCRMSRGDIPYFWTTAFESPLWDTGVGLVVKSCLTLATPWTVACQAPLPMGFSRHEYWSGLPFPSPVDLPIPRIEPWSPALQVDSLLTELQEKPFETLTAPFSFVWHDWQCWKE